jgi:hypothetical protein
LQIQTHDAEVLIRHILEWEKALKRSHIYEQNDIYLAMRSLCLEYKTCLESSPIEIFLKEKQPKVAHKTTTRNVPRRRDFFYYKLLQNASREEVLL